MANQNVSYPDLDTPAVLLDLDLLEANMKEMTLLAAQAGIKLRPHVKIHETAILSKMQIEAGECGIEVGNVAQAERMIEEGIDDILIAHPFYGHQKLEALKRFVNKPGLKFSIVVDMVEQGKVLSQVGQSVGVKIPVLIKVDIGVNRYGVLPGEPTLTLARRLRELAGIELVGIYAHEAPAIPTDECVARTALEVGSIMAEMARMLRREGFKIRDVAVGASSTFASTCRYIRDGILQEITEIHPGARVIGDIRYMRSLGNTRKTCALTVLTTVVSTTHAAHVIIDAGYKTFGADSLIERQDSPGFFWEGKPSFGSIQGRLDLWLGRIAAESAWVFYKDPNAPRLSLGDRLEIVPNNATLVINIHDQLYGVRKGAIERVIPVTGRGLGS